MLCLNTWDTRRDSQEHFSKVTFNSFKDSNLKNEHYEIRPIQCHALTLAVGTRDVLWMSVAVAFHDISPKRLIYCLSLGGSYNGLL